MTAEAMRPLFAGRLLGGPRVAMSPAESRRSERVLAAARAVLVTMTLVAVLLDPARVPDAAFTGGLLGAYLLQSLVVFGVLTTRERFTPVFSAALHALDVLWASALVLVAAGPNSPFFVFFLFTILTAAYRWGLWETLATSAAASGIFGLLLYAWGDLFAGHLGYNELATGLAYLLIAATLLGYLAEEEKGVRVETQVLARVMTGIQGETSLGRALRTLAGELLSAFRATEWILAAEERDSGQVFIWRANAAKPLSVQNMLPYSAFDMHPSDPEVYFFEAPAPAWVATRRVFTRKKDYFQVRTLPIGANRGQRTSCHLPDRFLKAHATRSLMCASFDAGAEWKCRIFLLNPPRRVARLAALRVLQRLTQQAGPIVYSVYLVRRLRTRAGAIERDRVARELHDGVIQSLFSVEMQLDAVRRQSMRGVPLTAELEHIQGLVHEEVLSLRDLMQHMRSTDVAPGDLLSHLASMVDRFGRESGISARFVSDLREVLLTPRVCRELSLIVREALVNVRKHSSARNVLVSLSLDRGRSSLVIDQDGHGFSFTGRLSQAELDATRRGPVVIKERVRAIGGELTIDSVPGRGARLEIALPGAASA
jgi:signal transduction histidine kinase